MKKNKGSIFVSMLLLIGLGGCGESKIDLEETVKLDVNKILNEVSDTIENGLARYYYTNNGLKSEVNYKDGKKEGVCKYYREDGTFEGEAYFKNDKPNGISRRFHKDGEILKSETFWVNNKQFGGGNFYYESGNKRLFNSTDFFGNTMFVITWDEKGDQTKYDGVVFSPELYFSEVESKIRVNKELIIKVAVATPPETKTIIKMGLLGEERREVEIVNYSATYPITFKKPGKYKMVTIGELYDLEGELLQRDSVATNINVTE